ncbi:PspA/IM30 family protein [Corynebacterium lowii]|uniref:PspA/IM30 family protein n=1 Tax=Corynebacterium lowii TaxID=1544413 RepID=A0A0Q0U4S8_9CORY|nr:PspA/IM30 family protein [Corynebacterium lowii]KQB86960.1 PspA/IM30 family protein [Corynebacterium lowii]MDP9852460.1 phage shock protein A [Corynebacterium lowii]
MANPFSKGWNYLKASLDQKIDENADPKVQIHQATEAAKEQHQEITEHAAAIIGNKRQLEMKLDRLLKEQDSLQGQAKQAITMADQASAQGDSTRAAEYTNTAEVFASQLVAVEQQIEELKTSHQQASQAAEQAQQKQRESEARLKEQMAQIDQLRAQVDQAKMQEASNEAIGALSASADDSTPTLDGVREKIERRYANALGAQELAEGSVNSRMDEIAAAGRDMKASARLDQIRAELNAGNTAQDNAALEQGESEGREV